MRRRTFIMLGSALVAAGAFVLALPHIQERYFYRNPGQSAREQLNPWRQALLRPQRVVEAMHLEHGNTVLDLGAGYGFFTFALAQAVGDDGKVFATDSNPDAADFLTLRAKQAEVKNVIPVVVQQFGLDPFYKTHAFDVIMACDVIPYIGDAAAQRSFLGELGRSLTENGRLWVLMHRFDADFDAAEFGDWRAVVQALRSAGAPTVLRERLRPDTRTALDKMSAGEASEPCCAPLLDDLNRMLDDPTLWPELLRRFQPLGWYLSERYKRPRDYLIAELEKTGGFAPTAPAKPAGSRPLLRLLNRLIISDLLDTIVYERAFHLDEYAMHNWRHMIEGVGRLPTFLAVAENAGYQLVQEHKLVTSHRIWEFRRGDALTAKN